MLRHIGSKKSMSKESNFSYRTLTVTLRILATGDTFQPLSFQFRVSDPAISYIVKKVCNAIVKYLVPLSLKVPLSEEEWLSIDENFET